MELLLSLNKYEEKINCKGLSEKDIEEIKNYVKIEGRLNVSEENIGTAADYMVILVSILTIVNIFLLGDKIDKGIEGWINLGKRIKKFIKNKELVAIDKDGASLLAIEYISKIENINSLLKESEYEINLVRLDKLLPDNRKPNDLISKPYNYFIQNYLINNEKFYVIGIKSTGEVELIKCFECFEYGNLHGIAEIKVNQ